MTGGYFKSYRMCALISLLVLSSNVKAENTAISIHGDLFGGGLEITKPLSEHFNGRLGYHQSSYQGSDFLTLMEQSAYFWSDLLGMTKSNNVYNHDGKQQMVSFVADWYPHQGSQFRYSLGLGYNQDSDNFIAQEQITGGYNIGGTTYSAGQVGTLSGTRKYKGLVPYFGWGWGNPLQKKDGWGFTFDLGFSYTGKPSVTLAATATPLAADLEAERQRIENESLKFLPMLSLGLSYGW